MMADAYKNIKCIYDEPLNKVYETVLHIEDAVTDLTNLHNSHKEFSIEQYRKVYEIIRQNFEKIVQS
jgi:hypothetical protein